MSRTVRCVWFTFVSFFCGYVKFIKNCLYLNDLFIPVTYISIYSISTVWCNWFYNVALYGYTVHFLVIIIWGTPYYWNVTFAVVINCAWPVGDCWWHIPLPQTLSVRSSATIVDVEVSWYASLDGMQTIVSGSVLWSVFVIICIPVVRDAKLQNNQ